jgi:hypothetical protein
MRRRISGSHDADRSIANELPDGVFLVQVERAHYRWHAQKPYYLIRFTILEPRHVSGRSIAARIYCTPRAMWKLSWFLRDFGYDTELLGREEIEDKALIGLSGVVKATHMVVHGIRMLNLDGFAPASQWEELSAGLSNHVSRSEVPR